MSHPNRRSNRILLIDDDQDLLTDLETRVKAVLGGIQADVVAWRPEPQQSVIERFAELSAGSTALVVTDYDLTKNGPAGFFGTSVVSWCQNGLIPVGDYSRGNLHLLPTKPNIYEFRFETSAEAAAKQIAATYCGFRDIESRLEENPDLLTAPSLPSMLARVLGRPHLAPHFTQYSIQVGANGALRDYAKGNRAEDKTKLAVYILGHFLFNCVLEYPGPILSIKTLCAYLAVHSNNAEIVGEAFKNASYNGPFSELDIFFYREDIDAIIETWADRSSALYKTNVASYRRTLLEEVLNVGPLERYPCPRCNGDFGGFRCPFTDAVVCELGSCSIGRSTFFPEGADLLRIEKERFEEEAPMLGR